MNLQRRTPDRFSRPTTAAPTESRAANSRGRCCVVAGIVGSCLLLLGPSVRATEDERFLNELRQRELFRLAEVYCLEQLERDDLSDERRAELTIELSRTFATHARLMPFDGGDELWQHALVVTRRFAEQNPNSPRRVLVQLQGAMIALTQAELLQERFGEAELDEATGAELRAPLDAAIAALRELDEQVEARLRTAGTRPTPEEPFDAGALRGLQRQIRFHLAQSYLAQANYFAPRSPDATNALTQAVELLEPLSQSQVDDLVTWESRLAEVAAYRRLRDGLRASRGLQQLRAADPPVAIQLRAAAEEIQLAVEFDRVDDLQKLAVRPREIEGQASAELDFALLEAYLALWRDATRRRNDAVASQWQAKAEQAVRDIEATADARWSRRAESLLTRRLTASPQVADLKLLERLAEGLYRREQFDEARAAYDRARAAADTQGDAAAAFQFGYKAAAIEHGNDAHAAALARYHELSQRYPDQPQASEVHLLAVHHAGQLARHSNDELARYEALLDEHLQSWPRSSTADTARLQLARLRAHQKDWSGVVAVLRELSPLHPQFVTSLDTIGRAYESLLAEKESAGQPTTPTAEQAALFFEGVVVGSDRRLPERMSEAQQQAVLWASRFWIDYYRGNYDRPIALLRAGLRDANVSPEWRGEALPLWIVALAAHGRTDEAEQGLTELTGLAPSSVLRMLERLSRVASATQSPVAERLAQLQVQTAAWLDRHQAELSEADGARLRRLQARSLTAAGQFDAAREVFQQLAEAHPDDGELQEEYAAWLLERGDRPSVEAALQRWREVERRSRAGSDRWFRAKYALASAHQMLGNKDQAAKIITVTQVLHPELGGPVMKARFLKLLEQSRP